MNKYQLNYHCVDAHMTHGFRIRVAIDRFRNVAAVRTIFGPGTAPKGAEVWHCAADTVKVIGAYQLAWLVTSQNVRMTVGVALWHHWEGAASENVNVKFPPNFTK